MKTKFAKFAMAAAIFTSLSGLSVTAIAGEASPEDISRFIKMTDMNKDGMVSKAEMMKRANAAMAASKNKDGMIDSKAFMDFLLDIKKSDGNAAPAKPAVMMSKADMMKKIDSAFAKADAAKKLMIDQAQVQMFLAELLRSGA
jgi:hypothetical protein